MRHLSLFAVALLAIAIGLFLERTSQRLRSLGHAVSEAKIEMALIQGAASQLSVIEPGAFATLDLRKLDARTLYSALASTNYGVRTLIPRRDWDSSGELRDPWGRPFQIRNTLVGEETNGASREIVFTYVLWSLGPNGINDHGSGDDISGGLTIAFPEKKHDASPRR